MIVNNLFNRIDEGLDKGAVIPVVSSFTGALRVTAGVCEILYSLTVIITGIGLRNLEVLKNGGENAVRGFFKITKGLIEAIPFAGNLIMYTVRNRNPKATF